MLAKVDSIFELITGIKPTRAEYFESDFEIVMIIYAQKESLIGSDDYDDDGVSSN